MGIRFGLYVVLKLCMCAINKATIFGVPARRTSLKVVFVRSFLCCVTFVSGIPVEFDVAIVVVFASSNPHN